jgi:diguanylate cyclase (GGDEF)-like protein
VVTLPGWFRVGMLSDAEAVRRIAAATLYGVFVPLAFLVELAYGGAQAHWLLIIGATGFLAAQAAAVWLVRPMPLRGWTVLIVAVPATYVLYAYASQSAGEALSVVLVIPVAWMAVFLPGRSVMLGVAMNSVALAWLPVRDEAAQQWLLFAVRVLTLIVVAGAVHLLVAALRCAQREAERRAGLDPTTGLVSRARMLDILDAHRREDGQRAALVLLDLDHFKQVNDTYGHLAGDQALRDVARIFESVTREGDTVARWGGEEFLGLITSIDEHQLPAAADKMRQAVEEHPFRLEGMSVRLTASVGATMMTPAVAIRTLVAAADDALYKAKAGGRNQTVIARPRLYQVTVTSRQDLEAARHAVERAAVTAGLARDQTFDAIIAVSEACTRLLPADDCRVQLAVTVHDRLDTLTVIVEDRTPRRVLRRSHDALNVMILDRIGDEVRFDEHTSASDVRIVFAKLDEPQRRARRCGSAASL